ncbi:MAG: hypothetical protein JSS49_12425 [Planctomycetes bacterium]|nr:hypothetical protein [Planctomycetota bacterium]
MRLTALRTRICSSFVVALACGLFASRVVAQSDDSREPEQPAQPLVVVTSASVNRVVERGLFLCNLVGRPLSREEFWSALSPPPGVAEFQGIDRTKPIGIAAFYEKTAPLAAEENVDDAADSPADATKPVTDPQTPDDEVPPSPEVESKPDPNDPFRLIEPVFTLFDDLSRSVFYVPVTDLDAVLTLLELVPDQDRPGVYFEKGSTDQSPVFARRRGDYLILGGNVDLVTNCPDPATIFQQQSDDKDVVVSFRSQGLPTRVRELWAFLVKFGFRMSLERQEDEAEHDYDLRRAWGTLVGGLLNLAVSHIDAVNVVLNVDPARREVVSTVDLVGPENGKLVQFGREVSLAYSPFAETWDEHGRFALGVSLSIPYRHSRPISVALKKWTEAQLGLDLQRIGAIGTSIEIATKLVELGTLDLLCIGPASDENWSPVLALKFPHDTDFPRNFRGLLKSVQQLTPSSRQHLQLDAASVADLPVHALTSSALQKVLGPLFEEITAIGNQFFLSATPDAICLATSTEPPTKSLPPALTQFLEKSAEAAQAPADAVRPVNGQRLECALFRLSLHMRNWKCYSNSDAADSPADASIIAPTAAGGQSGDQVVPAIAGEKPDGLHLVLRPSPTGLRLTIQLEEALVAFIAREFAH